MDGSLGPRCHKRCVRLTSSRPGLRDYNRDKETTSGAALWYSKRRCAMHLPHFISLGCTCDDYSERLHFSWAYKPISYMYVVVLCIASLCTMYRVSTTVSVLGATFSNNSKCGQRSIVFSSADWANSITGQKLSVCMSVCLCVNQCGTNRNRYTRLEILHAQSYMANSDHKAKAKKANVSSRSLKTKIKALSSLLKVEVYWPL